MCKKCVWFMCNSAVVQSTNIIQYKYDLLFHDMKQQIRVLSNSMDRNPRFEQSWTFFSKIPLGAEIAAGNQTG